MKKLVLAATVVVSAIALGGIAMADVGTGLVGNTVTLTAADGSQTQIFYPDASNIQVKTADGTVSDGSWHVAGDTICTQVGDAPENCTAPIEEAPAAGSSGVIEGEQGEVKWSVSEGKAF